MSRGEKTGLPGLPVRMSSTERCKPLHHVGRFHLKVAEYLLNVAFRVLGGLEQKVLDAHLVLRAGHAERHGAFERLGEGTTESLEQVLEV